MCEIQTCLKKHKITDTDQNVCTNSIDTVSENNADHEFARPKQTTDVHTAFLHAAMDQIR